MIPRTIECTIHIYWETVGQAWVHFIFPHMPRDYFCGYCLFFAVSVPTQQVRGTSWTTSVGEEINPSITRKSEARNLPRRPRSVDRDCKGEDRSYTSIPPPGRDLLQYIGSAPAGEKRLMTPRFRPIRISRGLGLEPGVSEILQDIPSPRK